MKLVRHGQPGRERPGLIDEDGRLRDLSVHIPDISGPTLAPESLDRLRALDPADLPEVAEGVRIGACLASVPSFLAIGLNYRAHAHETGAPIPKEPILFAKAASSLAGPHDDLILPPDATKADWEVELGVVIGRAAWRIGEAEALAHVAGYCTLNDVSERDWQMNHGGKWIKGKSGPGFGPAGPWLVTADAVPDPQDLRLHMDVNGERLQDSTTADMIFSVAEIIAYLSRFLRLMPGDLIATGTPSGVGMGMDPPRFLRPGDLMAAEVEGLGAQRQWVVTG